MAYRNLANDIADMVNEQNEAYVAVAGSSNLPENPSSVPDNSTRPNSSNSHGNNRPNNEANNEANSNNAENVERLDGHDEAFDPPVSADYECPICMMVLRNPVQTTCGHRFCGGCIKRHVATNGRTCPIDNQELSENELYPDNFAKREINQFTVKCRTVKNNKECPWTGPLLNIEEHLKTCEFVEIPCPKGCNQNVERKVLDHHLKKECSKRTTTCQHCKTEVQHKNYKDHLGKCQKVTVACPDCNKKMLREKLTAGHEKECPKAQAVCEFKAYGCKWTGVRLQLQNHLKNEVSVATHLSLLCKATTVLLPTNGRDKNKDGASKSEASGSGSSSGNTAVSGNVLEELNRQRNRNAESIATVEAKIEQVERKTRDLTGRVDRQQRENEGSMTLLKNTLIELEARMCNGVYLWRITGYARHLENARDNVVTALHSPPFYTNFYGYKLCLRINPNGVDTGYGSHVSLFVHMMQSDWDDTLEWPFSGRISLSILDQSDDGEYKRHISETLVTRPNLLAFQRPTTPRNHKGYGYVEFAHIETLQDRQYLKNDCLLVRVQVFQ